MAWFITFHKEVPNHLAPRERHAYDICTMQIDSSHPDEKIKADEEDINQACARFANERGVKHWKEVAHGYRLSEVHYD